MAFFDILKIIVPNLEEQRNKQKSMRGKIERKMEVLSINTLPTSKTRLRSLVKYGILRLCLTTFLYT